jgi:hypothetical protein
VDAQLGNYVQGEEADRFAVGGGVAELIAADHAAGPAHVFDHDRRFAGNVRGQMLGDDASLDIGGAARRVVDDDGDRLALVELGECGLRKRAGGKHGHAGDEQHPSSHGFLPCDGRGVISSPPASLADRPTSFRA